MVCHGEDVCLNEHHPTWDELCASCSAHIFSLSVSQLSVTLLRWLGKGPCSGGRIVSIQLNRGEEVWMTNSGHGSDLALIFSRSLSFCLCLISSVSPPNALRPSRPLACPFSQTECRSTRWRLTLQTLKSECSDSCTLSPCCSGGDIHFLIGCEKKNLTATKIAEKKKNTVILFQDKNLKPFFSDRPKQASEF